MTDDGGRSLMIRVYVDDSSVGAEAVRGGERGRIYEMDASNLFSEHTPHVSSAAFEQQSPGPAFLGVSLVGNTVRWVDIHRSHRGSEAPRAAPGTA